MSLGKSSALKDVEVILTKKIDFLLTDLAEKLACTHVFVYMANPALLGHPLAKCHPVLRFRAIKMCPKARIWAQTPPTEVTTCKTYECFYRGFFFLLLEEDRVQRQFVTAFA